MPQIDPARLSRVIASLSKPKERVNSSSAQGSKETTSDKAQKGQRSPVVLRTRLQDRLVKLKQGSASFHETAPIVTIQEILRWEFGESILEHAEFERVAKKVAETMLEDKQLQSAIFRIIDEMVSAGI
jgi:hypothetical protein